MEQHGLSGDEFVASLNKRADVIVEHSKSIRLYLRSADQVFRQACVYKREGDMERAYVLFLKYSNLVLEEIPKHPEYQPGDEQVKSLRQNCVMALEICEASKPILVSQYLERQEAGRRAAQRLREESESAARSAYERRLEEERIEAKRVARQREIQLMEAQRTYELQKAAATMDRASSLEDGGLDYLDLVAPVEPTTVKPMISPPSVLASPPVIPPQPVVKPVFYTESGAMLRQLLIPSCIIDAFLRIAQKNTQKNIETCGVLAGKLAQNCFTITHLIVPKQVGTSDTCGMEGEEEVLEAQDRLDLLTLGWIHTHPTQSCFLSSIDLHTQFPYQLMMAEAVAIVVAPRESPNFGIFRLTSPPGMDVIGGCGERGFHQHRDVGQPLYRALGGGPTSHAQLRDSLPLQVIDLRP